jgi:uncharacterized protein
LVLPQFSARKVIVTRFSNFLLLVFASVFPVFAVYAEQDPPLTRIQAMTGCDRLAADPYDVKRPEGLPGIHAGLIDAPKALQTCEAAMKLAPEEARFAHQAGRAAMVLDAPRNWDKARGYFEVAANAGHGAAHRMLAEILMNPLGDQDRGLPSATAGAGAYHPAQDAAILAHLRQAENAGDIAALVLKGRMFLSGRLIYGDAQLAEALFVKAAEKGAPVGDLALGVFYAHGPSARRDYGQARASFERVMDLEEPDAFLAMGEMAERGLGEIRDIDKAKRLYEKAIGLGSISAITAMAVLVGSQNPDGRPDKTLLAQAASKGDAAAWLLLTAQTLKQTDDITALKAAQEPLRRMAAARHGAALVALGDDAEWRKSYDDALGYYAQGAKLGSARANALQGGVLSRQGRDVEAEPILQRAAQAGDDEAALLLAELLIRQFRQQAAEGWFQLAAYANVDGARRAIGKHYAEGTIGRQSITAARQWYTRAIEGGDKRAQLGLALALLAEGGKTGDYDEAKKALRAVPKGMDEGEARWQLGLMALNGLGQPVDAKAALDHFVAAAELGVTGATNMLGALYEGDQLGPPDLAKARQWYVKAAESNDTSAMFRLAALEVERGPIPEAEVEAVRWLERAAHIGLGEAKLALAAAFHYGIGTPKDSLKAFKLLSELADAGDFAGRLNVARAHEIGIGTPANPEEALARYTSIYEQDGSPLARLGLARLAEKGTKTTPPDPANALYLYRAIVESVNDEASLAVVRLKSAEGPLQDKDGALIELQRSLSQTLPETAAALARLVCPDKARVEECEAALGRVDEAVAYEYPEAAEARAKLHEEGIGKPKDPASAAALRAKAKENRRRQLLLGQFLFID